MISLFLLIEASLLLSVAKAHSAFWHPSMYGFNVTQGDFPYDNRPVAPLKRFTFQQWWFLDHPPNEGDFFTLEAGGTANAEIACTKSATSFFASSEGGDIRNPNKPDDPCPGSPTQTYHTNGLNDLGGCALAIAYKSDARDVQPEDFAVFSVNQTCVFSRNTQCLQCPPGGCVCAWFWVHREDSGGEENYMNGFKCNVTKSTSDVPLAKSKVPRRYSPSNCTYGAKQPFYWFQLERNNMFEGDFSPPLYLDRYAFFDGAQDDIFEDSYANIPDPSPVAAMPTLATNITNLINIGATLVVQSPRQLTTRPGKHRSLRSSRFIGHQLWNDKRSRVRRGSS
ncbi:hypothetical protein DL96DRAFT_1594033 [Flagelloscypha sp. PMI_526]|nr:hypothetical protein DL96DRAFT_1594033 [Flagelloscypha sp. PMI_526]